MPITHTHTHTEENKKICLIFFVFQIRVCWKNRLAISLVRNFTVNDFGWFPSPITDHAKAFSIESWDRMFNSDVINKIVSWLISIRDEFVVRFLTIFNSAATSSDDNNCACSQKTISSSSEPNVNVFVSVKWKSVGGLAIVSKLVNGNALDSADSGELLFDGWSVVVVVGTGTFRDFFCWALADSSARMGSIGGGV